MRSVGRRDLQDLRRSSRNPAWAYLQKQLALRAPRAKGAGTPAVDYQPLAAFSPSRLWKWFEEYLKFRIGRRHPFATYDAAGGDAAGGDCGVYRLEGDAEGVRIALAGDWATGTDEAAEVGALIAHLRPHYTIHLGDVYFVGDPVEVGETFLGERNPRNSYAPCTWPKGSRGAFTLLGNHEMYARGIAYFRRMLPWLGVSGSAGGQRASFFCLENDDWRIIALDTGYGSVGLPLVEYLLPPDCALRPEQLEWLRTVVRAGDDDPRGIVLLSHHQYFSRFDTSFPKPGRQLAEFFRRPVLWFWGHEHRLAIYEQSGVEGGIQAFGRCIGHGGMPVDLPLRPLHDHAVEFVDERHYHRDEDITVGYNGFASMTLRGRELTVDYVDVDGSRLYTEAWTVEDGSLVRRSARAWPDGPAAVV